MRRAALTLALLLPAAAAAHDLWLERDGAGLVLRAGHRGDQPLPVDRAKVKALRCLSGGTVRDLAVEAAGSAGEVHLAARCDAASALLDGGYWSLTPDGEVNEPRTRAAQVVRAWASRQLAKWVDVRVPAAAGAALGDELELVPVSDLARARRGDKITLRVLSAGRPVAGAVVAIDHKALGETDFQGEIRVRVRAAEVETVSATVRRRLQAPEADELVLEASLTFEVAR